MLKTAKSRNVIKKQMKEVEMLFQKYKFFDNFYKGKKLFCMYADFENKFSMKFSKYLFTQHI